MQAKSVTDISKMRTMPCQSCYLCGEPGEVIHSQLFDRLHDISGAWAFRKCSSENCRLVWLDPIIIEEDIGKAYVTYYTHSNEYSTRSFRLRQRLKRGLLGLRYGYNTGLLDRLLALPLFFIPFLSEQVLTSICSQLLPKKTGKLLEVGFGNGTLLNSLHEIGWEVEGVDFDAVAVESVRQNFKLKVHTGSLVEQKYSNDYFDAIVLSHVIEHVHNPCALLTECCRILKPEGKVILLTPNIESFGYQTFGSHWLHLDPPRHIHLFSPTTLRTLVDNSGLTIVQVKTNARDANNSWVMSKNIERAGKCHTVVRLGVIPKLQSRYFQFKEYRALSKKSSVGEEIVMIATKKTYI